MQSHDPHEPVSSVPDYAAALSSVEPVADTPVDSLLTNEDKTTSADFAGVANDIIYKLKQAEPGKRDEVIASERKVYEQGAEGKLAEHFARVLLDAPTWDRKNSKLQVMQAERKAEAKAKGVKNLQKSPEEAALKLEVITLNHDLRELFEAKGEGFTTAELTHWYSQVLGEKDSTAVKEVSGVVAEIALRRVLSEADFLQAVEYGTVEEDDKGRDIVGLIKHGNELITLTADSKAGGQDTIYEVDHKLGIKLIMGIDLGRLDVYGRIDAAYIAELQFAAGLALQKAVVERAGQVAKGQAQ